MASDPKQVVAAIEQRIREARNERRKALAVAGQKHFVRCALMVFDAFPTLEAIKVFYLDHYDDENYSFTHPGRSSFHVTVPQGDFQIAPWISLDPNAEGPRWDAIEQVDLSLGHSIQLRTFLESPGMRALGVSIVTFLLSFSQREYVAWFGLGKEILIERDGTLTIVGDTRQVDDFGTLDGDE